VLLEAKALLDTVLIEPRFLPPLSLHIFGLLFLVPAMLSIRREAALLAAICIATYSYEGAWAGILISVVAFVAGQRWPALLMPVRGPATA
jgi:hypothetical protein